MEHVYDDDVGEDHKGYNDPCQDQAEDDGSRCEPGCVGLIFHGVPPFYFLPWGVVGLCVAVVYNTPGGVLIMGLEGLQGVFGIYCADFIVGWGGGGFVG